MRPPHPDPPPDGLLGLRGLLGPRQGCGRSGRHHVPAPAARAPGGWPSPHALRVLEALLPHFREAHEGQQGRSCASPRSHEQGLGNSQRRGGQRAVPGPGSGLCRRCRAHGRALPARHAQQLAPSVSFHTIFRISRTRRFFEGGRKRPWPFLKDI